MKKWGVHQHPRTRRSATSWGSPRSSFWCCLNLFAFYVVRGGAPGSLGSRGKQLLNLAQRQHNTMLSSWWAHGALGQALCFLGEFAPARGHLEQAITLYRCSAA